MRIRKHAARFLSSLSIPAQSWPAAAAEAAVATAAVAAAGPELEMHVCELNQSPWDAMAFTPPEAVPLHHYLVPQEVLEEEKGLVWGAMGSGQGEEEPAAAAAVSDNISGIAATRLSFRSHVKTEEMVDGDEAKRARKMQAKKKNYDNNTKNVRRKSTSSCALEDAGGEEKLKMEVESAAAAAAAVLVTCKKSDGKGWHCKRQAKHPHSLCEYHLAQVRSYYGSAAHAPRQYPQPLPVRKMPGEVDAKQTAAAAQDKKNIRKNTGKKRDTNSSCVAAASRTGRKPTSEFYYYYYSGFGPWWGRRRGSGERERGSVGNLVDPSNGDDEGGECAPSPMAHDQAPDDLDDDDDDDEDMEDVDVVGGCDGDGVAASGRRPGRKPIKARSLKSLL